VPGRPARGGRIKLTRPSRRPRFQRATALHRVACHRFRLMCGSRRGAGWCVNPASRLRLHDATVIRVQCSRRDDHDRLVHDTKHCICAIIEAGPRGDTKSAGGPPQRVAGGVGGVSFAGTSTGAVDRARPAASMPRRRCGSTAMPAGVARRGDRAAPDVRRRCDADDGAGGEAPVRRAKQLR
jgi:hypothetical protein